MTNSGSRTKGAWSFVSRREHHVPRIKRSMLLILLGPLLFAFGAFMIADNFPQLPSGRGEVVWVTVLLAAGVLLLAFGAYGLVTGASGAVRTEKDAIDLLLGDDGVTVRGGHVIPWAAITGATAVRWINQSKLPLLWRESDLNRMLILRLRDPLNAPGAASRRGEHTVRIRLERYPADTHLKAYKAAVATIRSRRIQVVDVDKHKQT